MSRPPFRSALLLLLGAAALSMGVARAPVAPPPAETHSTQTTFEEDYLVCGKEKIHVRGTQTVTWQTSQDSHGKWRLGFTRTTNGSGLGATSGTSYTLQESSKHAAFGINQGVAKTFTEQVNGKLVTTGGEKGHDTPVHLLSKVTLDAAGQLQTSVAVQSPHCK